MRNLESSFKYEDITECRICSTRELHDVLDLGEQPLANSLRSTNSSALELLFPLKLIRCDFCCAIQLSVNVNPRLMFQDYFWVTGTSSSSIRHCLYVAQEIIKRIGYSASILEIGSNDGTLLKELRNLTDSNLFGVDPATKISRQLKTESIRIFTEFFDSNFAQKFLDTHGRVESVVARNVLSHVPDLHDVMKGVSEILSDDGTFVMEFHNAVHILRDIHFDSIYHEHTFYHSLKSVFDVLRDYNLTPFDILESPISGGSSIIFATKSKRVMTESLNKAVLDEKSSGVLDKLSWETFAELAKRNLSQTKEYLFQNRHRKIMGFGASARSSTLLNAIGNQSRQFLAVADNNPLKWGHYTPGTGLRIDSPLNLIDESIEIIVIFPFNFESEIIEFLTNDLKWHGEVLLPLPVSPRVIKI